MSKVLVVDDTKNIRTLLSKCLEKEGYEVRCTVNGYEAIELCRNEKFDIIFLDIKMPNFSGTEVLRQIRNMGVETSVIVITAYPSIKNAVECTQMGAVAYMQKPFTAERVRSVLQEVQEKERNEKMKSEKLMKHVEDCINNLHLTEAIQILRKIISEKPLDPVPYLLMSKAYGDMKMHEEESKFRKIYQSLLQEEDNDK